MQQFITHLVIVAVMGIALAGTSLADRGEPAAPGSNLKRVATFDHQATGVTVAKDDRVFVNFPRWTEDSPVSVAEVMKDGSIKPYPDEAWNSWRNELKGKVTPGDHFVCVQSVVADHQGNLWVLDPASPAFAGVVPGGAKLVKFDLATNKPAQTIHFDEPAIRPSSYLNDVRFSPDDKTAYITDSGPKGGIVVVDIASGKARRLLEGHPSVLPERGVTVHCDGKPLKHPDGRPAEFSSDGIELSKDGKTLYWQALTGHTLYSISTDALKNEQLPAGDLAKQITPVGKNGVSDGLWLDDNGTMYISALEEDAIKIRKIGSDDVKTLLTDKQLRWPDTFSQASDGTIYVTASRIMDSAMFKPDAKPPLETYLFSFPPAK
jgi:sugar lactone lactonase YvrE